MTIGSQLWRVMIGATGTFVPRAALAEPAAERLTVSVIAIVASAAAARLLFSIMKFPFGFQPISLRCISSRYRRARSLPSRTERPPATPGG